MLTTPSRCWTIDQCLLLKGKNFWRETLDSLINFMGLRRGCGIISSNPKSARWSSTRATKFWRSSSTRLAGRRRNFTRTIVSCRDLLCTQFHLTILGSLQLILRLWRPHMASMTSPRGASIHILLLLSMVMKDITEGHLTICTLMLSWMSSTLHSLIPQGILHIIHSKSSSTILIRAQDNSQVMQDRKQLSHRINFYNKSRPQTWPSGNFSRIKIIHSSSKLQAGLQLTHHQPATITILNLRPKMQLWGLLQRASCTKSWTVVQTTKKKDI